MSKYPLKLDRLRGVVRAFLCVGLLVMVTSTMASAQGAGSTTPAQPIWTAPTGGVVPEQQVNIPSAASEAGDLSLVALCQTPDARYETLLATCEEVLVRVVQSLGARAAADADAQADAVNFDMQSRAHLLAALKAQSDRGAFLFNLAVVLVVLGIVAAALQFLKSWRSPTETNIELAISEKQLSVKTSWIGVVLLGLSMGFLVIYLVFVYEITPLG